MYLVQPEGKKAKDSVVTSGQRKRLTVHRETEEIFRINAKFSTGYESLGPMLVRTMSRLIQKK